MNNSAKKEIDMKKKLELLFKIIDYYNLSDLTANHASILSSDKKGFFINKHKYLFSEIKKII